MQIANIWQLVIEQLYPFHRVDTKERIAGQWLKAGKSQEQNRQISRLYSLEPLAGVGIFVGGGEMELRIITYSSVIFLNRFFNSAILCIKALKVLDSP